MSTKQGFLTDGATLDEYVYQENTAGYSASIGLDYSGNVFNINVLAEPGANPSTGIPQISINPTGDVIISPVSDGNFIASATGIGDVNLLTAGGNIVIDQDTGNLQIVPFGIGVVLSNDDGILSSVNATEDGQVLIGATGAEPIWANITSPKGTVTITNGPNSIGLDTNSGISGNNSFFAYQSGSIDYAPGMTTDTMGSRLIWIKTFDNGGNLYVGNGVGSPMVFTAPATGIYFLNFNLWGEPILGMPGLVAFNLQIVTTTTTYNFNQNVNMTNPPQTGNLCAIAAMSLGDTATFVLNMNSSVRQSTTGQSGVSYFTWVSGYRIA